MLVLPQPLPAKTGRRKKAINDKAKEITDAAVLQEMKEKEQPDVDAKITLLVGEKLCRVI